MTSHPAPRCGAPEALSRSSELHEQVVDLVTVPQSWSRPGVQRLALHCRPPVRLSGHNVVRVVKPRARVAVGLGCTASGAVESDDLPVV